MNVSIVPLAIKVLNWQPCGRLMVVGLAFVAIGVRATIYTRLSIAGAGVAATSAFLLDDQAAITLASSPTSLPARRLHRVALAAITVGLWWLAAVAVATIRVGSFPLAGRALQLGMFVAVALAASAVAAGVGDRTTGGFAGAACCMVVYATTYLPPQRWLPLPAQPDTPGATTRLLVALGCALAVLAYMSRDPAASKRFTWRVARN